MNTVISIISTLLIIYLALGLVLYFGQRSILYYPTPYIEHGFTEEVFRTETDIRVIVINPGEEKALLYFGGNADSMAMNASELSFELKDLTLYLVNYRGYGGSGGSPTEAGLYQDALFIFDELRSRHADLFVLGRSLGSGVATKVASQRVVGKLVLVTPFDSVERVAAGHYPIYPATLMVRDRYDSIGRANRIQVPTLVLIAEHDRVIPRVHSERLATALPDAEVHILEGTDHNSIGIHPDYYTLIRNFL